MVSLKEAARHEASHAFSFYKFGGKLHGVWCGKEKKVRGSHPGRFSGGWDRVEEMVTIMLCGPSAALRDSKNPWDPTIYRIEEIKDCIALLELRGWKMPDHWTEADFWANWSPKARTFVDDEDNWQMIEALAAVLEVKKYMTGQEVAKLFEKEYQKIFGGLNAFLPDDQKLLRPTGALPWAEHGNGG